MTNEIYFNNVLEYGDLYLDKVFNEFEDENIIFVCKDKNENYFFAVCYEFRFKLAWILCGTDAISLIKLLSKKIDLHTMFANSNKMINIISDKDGIHITEVKYENFAFSFLPTPGVYLKPNFDLTYYFYDLYKKYINPIPVQSTRFIDFRLDMINDEVKYSASSLTSNIEYNPSNLYIEQEEYTRVILVDAA